MNHLDEILKRTRAITQYYIKKNGTWDISYSLLHIHSEVTEAYESIRNNRRRKATKEELGDIFLTTLEACHIFGLDDNEIKHLIFNSINKCEKRISDNLT